MCIQAESSHQICSGSWPKSWKATVLDCKLCEGREPALLIFVLGGPRGKNGLLECFEELNEFRKQTGVIIDHYGPSN